MPNRSRWLLPLLLLSATCARRVVPPAAVPPAPAMAPVVGLRVLLIWSAPVDLDLYLTEPTSETVYFGNNPSRTGARLVRDTRCGDVRGADSFMEEAYVPIPRAGRYRVGVDFIDRCGAPAQPASYRIVAELNGRRREATGVIALQAFQAIALEFDLQPGARDGGLTLSRRQRDLVGQPAGARPAGPLRFDFKEGVHDPE